MHEGGKDGRGTHESPLRVLLVTVLVCLACSLAVTSVEVWLRPRRHAHQERERNAHIVSILRSIPGLVERLGPVDAADLETRVVDLESGSFVDDVAPASFDQRKEASDATTSKELDGDDDPAELGRRENRALVYLLREDGRIRVIILPVRGKGYSSMLYGYLALDGRGETVLGLTFYEQQETPGIGSLVQDEKWLSGWSGKRVRDAEGRVRVRVAEPGAKPDPTHEVDAITGATVTSFGVTNLLAFWLGKKGFGPFLARLRDT